MSLTTREPVSNGSKRHSDKKTTKAELEKFREERRQRVEIYHQSEYFAALKRVVNALTELQEAFGEVLDRDTAEVEAVFLQNDLLDESGADFIEGIERVARDASSFAWTVKNLAELFYSDWPYVPWPEEWKVGAAVQETTEDVTPCAVVGGKARRLGEEGGA